MSRVLQWGDYYAGESLDKLLARIQNYAIPCPMDRWRVTFTPLKVSEVEDYEQKIAQLYQKCGGEEIDDDETLETSGSGEDRSSTSGPQSTSDENQTESMSLENSNKSSPKPRAKGIPKNSPKTRKSAKSNKESLGSSGTIESQPSNAKLSPSMKKSSKTLSSSSDKISPVRRRKSASNSPKVTKTSKKCLKTEENEKLNEDDEKVEVVHETIEVTEKHTVVLKDSKQETSVTVTEEVILDEETTLDKDKNVIDKKLIIHEEENVVIQNGETNTNTTEDEEEEEGESENNNDSEIVFKEKICVIHNYFSFGIDSRVAYDFHVKREKSPGLFPHQVINKAWYGILGIKHGFKELNKKPIHKRVYLEMDGEIVKLPKGLKTLLFLQIPSYSSGINPWDINSEKVGKQSVCDGKIEVIGLHGILHMGRIRANMGCGVCIGQASEVNVITTTYYPCQVDGEPFIIPPSRFRIEKTLTGNMLYHLKHGKELRFKTITGNPPVTYDFDKKKRKKKVKNENVEDMEEMEEETQE